MLQGARRMGSEQISTSKNNPIDKRLVLAAQFDR